MKIERMREILSNVNSTNTSAGEGEYTWYEGFDSGVAEALKALEVENVVDERIFDQAGMCNILGGK